MPSRFTHLHVASGYSLRYGASSPQHLVEQATEAGLTSLALTDRDGLYGAVKFVAACRQARIDPALGVDLAVGAVLPSSGRRQPPRPGVPGPVRRNPVRGGADTDPRLPRVTVLALASGSGTGLQPGRGWGQLCRLVTATHLRGERGRPVATAELIAGYAQIDDGTPALTVLLGPDSEYGRAVLAGRADTARAVLEYWRALLPPACLAVEVVCHRGPQGSSASVGHAARMLNLARQEGVPAILGNAVRHATRDGAMTVDVLDAARRLVAISSRHLDRTTSEGYLADEVEMVRRAHEIAAAAGDPATAKHLLALTESLASRCLMDADLELGLTEAHLPEAEVLGLVGKDADVELARRCQARISWRYPRVGRRELERIDHRLKEELGLIGFLGIPTYFLTIANVCDLIRDMGVRVAARGSGAGSLVNHLLGVSGVDPLRHDLLMERFVTRLRTQLPDVDLDVESDRRLEVYEKILDAFGGDRVSCVSMMDTYRARHAVRDVGAALGMPPGEVDTIAKAFPHVRARDVRSAIADLPELRARGLDRPQLSLLFDLVERLDGLPRHIALHPCGVLISDAGLLERTPVEASWTGFPMSQFDKDDVEQLGLLKLDVLGIRMQSAMSYAIAEVARVDGPHATVAGAHDPAADYIDGTGLIDLDAVPHDDPATFELIRSTRTLGCFQIESPGQRELVGKFAPETFHDLIIDISLFRPGPVKSDMVTPFLRARQGWVEPEYLHPALRPVLEDTCGVVVFHEQVLQIVCITTGCDLAEADEFRRAMGIQAKHEVVETWFRHHAERRYDTDGGPMFDAAAVDRIWSVLKAFASFGFCKAHAAAFALPTYQSAWLKAHHPAAFLAGVLTHDPGMYPKRLILDDARNFGIAVLPLDVNHSAATYRVENLHRPNVEDDESDRSPYGIRIALAEVKGISAAEVQRIIAGQPYHSLADFWQRAQVARPVVERLIVTGAFDEMHGLTDTLPVPPRHRLTRRDLLLQLADLERWNRPSRMSGDRRPSSRIGRQLSVEGSTSQPGSSSGSIGARGGDGSGVRQAARSQSQAAAPVLAAHEHPVQLALDLGESSDRIIVSGLPEMTGAERTRAELEVLGLDVGRHVLEFYQPMLEALAVTRARDVREHRSRAEILVAGVKVATQTPPVRSGRRVVFLTLDDSTGPVDATFFEDVQGSFAGTVFHSWLLVVRGVLRRTGHRGVSLRATGAWELPILWEIWTQAGVAGVLEVLHADTSTVRRSADSPAVAPAAVVPVDIGGTAPGRVLGSSRDDGALNVAAAEDWAASSGLPSGDRGGPGVPIPARNDDPADLTPGGRRVLLHPSGFRQSPYADLQPPGEDTRQTRRMLAAHVTARQERPEQEPTQQPERRRRAEPPRKLWHSSPGSSGR